jgi:hypothetical protein
MVTTKAVEVTVLRDGKPSSRDGCTLKRCWRVFISLSYLPKNVGTNQS